MTRRSTRVQGADATERARYGIVPVLLGEGIPLFATGFPQRNFKLTENETYSQGLIGVRYRRKR